jgi:phytoene synthase
LTALALGILGARNDTVTHIARHVGVGWGLVGLLRAVPFHASARRLYLPADLMSQHGVLAEDVFAGKNGRGLAAVAEIVARRAYHHFDVAQAANADIPRSARSPLLLATMGQTDLTEMSWSAVRPPMLKLIFRSLTTGY